MKEKGIGAAIRTIRKSKNMTLEDIALSLGVNTGNLSRLERGLQGISEDGLRDIARVLGVRVLDIYLEAEGENVSVGPDIKGTVPLISWVQAGNWEETIDNLQKGEGERIETTYRVRKHTYALRVDGDSMEPKFPEKCLIIIEPEEEFAPGKYVIAKLPNGKTTFKKYIEDGGIGFLKPLNEKYPMMQIEEGTLCCGVVKRMEMDV